MNKELNDIDLGVIETIRHVIGRLSSYQKIEINNMYDYFDSQEIYFNSDGIKWLAFYIFDNGECLSFLEFLEKNNVDSSSIFSEKPEFSEDIPEPEEIDFIVDSYLKKNSLN